MAVSHAIKQANGNNVRSAMSLIKMDGGRSFLSGTAVSLTVAVTNAAGGNVNASAARTFTSSGVLSSEALVKAFITTLTTALTGAWCYYSKNTDDEYVIHIKPKTGVAQDVLVSTPTFVPGT